MASPRKPASLVRPKPPRARRVLPAALARNAKSKHTAHVVALRKKGRDAIARIRERRADITSNFLDVGEALLELKHEGVAQALGRASFAEVCEKDLAMSLTRASQLIALCARMDREVVMKLGQDRAAAILDLVDATPADDAPQDVLHARVALPSGGTLDVAAASTQAIRHAAVALRHARAGSKRSVGRTTSHAEREQLAAVQARVHGVRALRGATFKLVAMGQARGADVVLRVPLALLEALARVLAGRR